MCCSVISICKTDTVDCIEACLKSSVGAEDFFFAGALTGGFLDAFDTGALVLVALGRTVAAFAFAVLEGVLVGILSHLWNS